MPAARPVRGPLSVAGKEQGVYPSDIVYTPIKDHINVERMAWQRRLEGSFRWTAVAASIWSASLPFTSLPKPSSVVRDIPVSQSQCKESVQTRRGCKRQAKDTDDDIDLPGRLVYRERGSCIEYKQTAPLSFCLGRRNILSLYSSHPSLLTAPSGGPFIFLSLPTIWVGR